VRRAPENPASGILLVDKPQGLTSHDVVARTRKFVGTRKVGHAGTLDPMATGLLVLGVNGSTRLLTWVVGLDKEYTATIRLGAATNTDDAEGELGIHADATALATATDTAIAAGVAALTGLILQRPSSVSAIKVDGKRAYTLAREGQDVVLASRPVTIGAFETLATRRDSNWVDVDVRVECSSGTYIRALARDLGEGLGVGGHLTALRRTRVGPFGVADAVAIDDVLPEKLLAPAAVATELFGRVELSTEQAADLGNGKRIALPPHSGPLAAVAPDGRLVGLVEVVDGRATVLVNFPPDMPDRVTE
jgi:tRNA pseudouridine55 synthase